MKFVALIYAEESVYADRTPAQMGAAMAEHAAFGEAARAAGVFGGGEGLQGTAAATTLRVRDGERLLTDGPFAETKEYLGGFYSLECKDLDEALEWAARIPEATYGSIEVRPVLDYAAIEAAANGAAAETA
jgi:hypothetical protein